MGSNPLWKRALWWIEALPIRFAYLTIWLTAKIGSRNAQDVLQAMWNAGLSVPEPPEDNSNGYESEIQALMRAINEMRRTNNPLLEKWADRIQDAVEDAAQEEASQGR